MKIETAVVLLGGLGSRFLPLSKTIPKEMWPLGDLPIIHYILEEIKLAGIKHIVFVGGSDNQLVLDYLSPRSSLVNVLTERGKKDLLSELDKIDDLYKFFKIDWLVQDKPVGNGDALLRVFDEKLLSNKEPIACLFADDVVEADKPCLAQLLESFDKYQETILALSRVPRSKLSAYGVVATEVVESKIHKIKSFVEKPKIGTEPSDLAVVGKYILMPDVISILSNIDKGVNGELNLADGLSRAVTNNLPIYGLEFEGRWLECGTKEDWLKSLLYLSLKDERYGDKIHRWYQEFNQDFS
ncbi:MAG: UTP--glucose-1-phosphate uridylyltransferase [Patescibacteria group bacterium]